MGKMLIDKLLRTCPGIENLYMLIRPKKGKDIHTRLDEIFDDQVSEDVFLIPIFFFFWHNPCVRAQVFRKLREEVPKFRHKIVAIAGDCGIAGLGLKLIDRFTLTTNVHIVFHAAATVRFDEKLKLSVNINVHGTKELLDLCGHMEQLKVSVYAVYMFFIYFYLFFVRTRVYFGNFFGITGNIWDRSWIVNEQMRVRGVWDLWGNLITGTSMK